MQHAICKKNSILKTISRFFYKIIFKPEFIITVKTDRTPIPLTFSFVKSRNISATVPAKYRMIPDKTPEGKHTLQTAIEIFGGKIIPEDNK